MRYLYLSILIICSNIALATHIVGGEISMVATNEQGATHRITLNLYFDAVNGNPQAEDANVTISVFRKSDNFLMGTAVLSKISSAAITYLNPLCATKSNLKTRLIQYSDLVILKADDFADPQGYYIVWERCCRNNIISNILNPRTAGMTFYLFFAPIKQNSKIFNNSSPVFPAIQADYVCVNQPFNFDFGGIDADGDSLAYSLVTPINGYANQQNPSPLARGSSNYPLVEFISGITEKNMIPGNPALSINPRTGKLNVTANTLGLYVFSVKVEEYRAGAKIGEVRRDFQLMVIECEQNNAPIVLAKMDGSSKFYTAPQVVDIKAQQSRCFELNITDPNPNQVLKIKLLPRNFPASYLPNSFIDSYSPLSIKDTLKTQICLAECVASEKQPLILDVLVSDNGCPTPQTDTLSLYFNFQNNSLASTQITTTLQNNIGKVQVGSPLAFTVTASSTDNTQAIVIEPKGIGFSYLQSGMSFQGGAGVGIANGVFTWTPDCTALQKNNWLVDFYVNKTVCNKVVKDSITVNLAALSKPNNPPSITTTLPNNYAEILIDPNNLTNIKFDINAKDADNDQLILKLLKGNFPNTIPQLSGKGNLSYHFDWTPTCETMSGATQKLINLTFQTEDNSCSTNKTDSVSVKLLLKSPQYNENYQPYNVITPNNDGKNDSFKLDNLPADICEKRFISIEIYNRWGIRLFDSSERNFEWSSKEAGEYYYIINFSHKKVKGILSVLE
jgi:gliding motility-associated-like protein